MCAHLKTEMLLARRAKVNICSFPIFFWHWKLQNYMHMNRRLYPATVPLTANSLDPRVHAGNCDMRRMSRLPRPSDLLRVAVQARSLVSTPMEQVLSQVTPI